MLKRIFNSIWLTLTIMKLEYGDKGFGSVIGVARGLILKK